MLQKKKKGNFLLKFWAKLWPAESRREFDKKKIQLLAESPKFREYLYKRVDCIALL